MLKPGTQPRGSGTDRDIYDKVRDMALFVVSELVRPDYTLEFGVIMRKEVRMAEQYPIKKEYVIYLHKIEHRQESSKNSLKPKPLFIPSHAERTAAAINSNTAITAMIQPMACAPRNLSFLSGMTARFSFGAEEKNLLSCIKATPAYSTRKYAAMTMTAAISVTAISARPPYAYDF